jgi:DNA-binding NarL/FixJ family response regulator
MSVRECDSFRVMLVEDDDGFRRSLAALLTSRFSSIIIAEAKNGGEAMEIMEGFLPQLIFMDIKLPDRNGLEITKKIKGLHPEIDIIVLTSYDFPEYREAARSSGAAGFLSKGSSSSEDIQDVVERLREKCAPQVVASPETFKKGVGK